MLYMKTFEQACVDFFASFAKDADEWDLTNYAFRIDARGSTVRGVEITFTMDAESIYLGQDAPSGGAIRTVVDEALHRKGYRARSPKLLVKATPASPPALDGVPF
jgi:hypothetical protein